MLPPPDEHDATLMPTVDCRRAVIKSPVMALGTQPTSCNLPLSGSLLILSNVLSASCALPAS